MKQRFIKSVLMVALCMAFGTTAAQTIIVNNGNGGKNVPVKPNIDMTKYDKRTLKNGNEVYTPKQNNSAKKLNAGEAEMVNVTFLLSYEGLNIYPGGSITVTGDNFSGELWMDYDWENDSYQLTYQLPVGTYDFLSDAFVEDGGTAYNIKELVQISNDTTITFYFAESNIQYGFKAIKPNGEEAFVDVAEYDENWDLRVVTPGNTNFIVDFISLILKSSGSVGSFFVSKQFEEYGRNPGATIFLNPVSDRYKLASERIFGDNNGTYLVKYESEDMSETLLQNNPDNFVLYQEQFTSIGNDFEGLGQSFSTIEMLDNKNNGGLSGSSVTISTPVTSIYVDPNRKDGNEPGKFDIMVLPTFTDNVSEPVVVLVHDFDWETFEEIEYLDTVQLYRTVTGLPVLINNDGSMEYVNTGHDACGNYSFHVPEGGGDIMEYPGHPQFSFAPENKALAFGSNSPICSVMAQNTIGFAVEGKHTAIKPCFIGRYGEIIGGYYIADIRYNGETISNSCVTIDQDMYEFAAQGHPDGVITAHFESHNAVVDGLQGSNVTDVYYDQRQADWTAPTLQMLTFKDHQGKISDRFATADEGILEFAGGDFNFQIDMETYQSWFDCKEQTVEVSYSPYCADQWLALDVEEVPGEFFMPGFGYFYRGSLQNVTNGSQTGWYDLRIKLTDASGNWQEQVISPAFRIGNSDPTGIKVVTSCDATEVARYTIDGRAISAPQAGVNIVMMSDGTVKKVLVK